MPKLKTMSNSPGLLNNRNNNEDDDEFDSQESSPLMERARDGSNGYSSTSNNNNNNGHFNKSSSFGLVSRFKKFNKPSKLAIIASGFVAFILLLNCLFVKNTPSGNKTTTTPCTTPECVLSAARVLQAMNRDADPCEDFYEFSCGGWLKSHPMPEDKSSIGTFNQLHDDNQLLIKTIFDGGYPTDPSLSPDDAKLDKQVYFKAQNYYKACLNEKEIDLLGYKPLINLLKGVYDQLVKDVSSKPTWLAKAVANEHLHFLRAIFNLYIGADDKNPEVNAINFGQSGLNMPSKEYYNDTDVVEIYNKAMVTVFRNILPEIVPDFDTNKTNEIVNNVIQFESSLATVSKPSAELHDPVKTYNPLSIKKLSTDIAPNFDWMTYLQTLFPPSEVKLEPNEDTVIIVNNPEYFGNMSKIVDETPKETLTFYLLWSYTIEFIRHLGKSAREPMNEYLEKVGSRPKVDPPRWQTCLARLDGTMGDVASKWYVKAVFKGDSKVAAEDSIKRIKDAFAKRLPNIPWIDKKTAELAVEKGNLLITKIGYPDFILSPKKSFEKYARLQYSAEDYFGNYVNDTVFSSWNNRKDIDDPVDRSRWEMTASTVNAYYNPPLNEIVFPAGILQPPFYSSSNPQYLNLGAIGAVVGHELTHAFDNNGRKYDSKGRLKDWWTNETAKNFEEKTKCFVYQYGNFTVDIPGQGTQHVNGDLTLGENLADNGGMSRALEAWKLHRSQNSSVDWALPGLSAQYSYDQLFFVSFAQVWCGLYTPATQLKRLRTDPHSPGKFRVEGAVQNSVEFAKAFQCKTGSRMNPKDKCLIW